MAKSISKDTLKDLDYFKKIILDKIESLKKDLLMLKNPLIIHLLTEPTTHTHLNFEEGSETLSRI